MNAKQLAKNYLDILFYGKNLDELKEIFASNFRFRGPFYTFDSAEDYINTLKSDPPKDFKYKIIASFEDKSSVCLIYQFLKPGVKTPMAQFFKISNGKISEILLIFDTRVFTTK
jgi:hypothetical protein